MKITNEDCMDLMARYKDNHFDLAIVDPPYGINVGDMAFLKEIKKTVKQKNGTRLSTSKNKKPYKTKEWDIEAPSQEYFNELQRISKEQIIFGVEYFRLKNLKKGRIKWNKGVPEGVSFSKYEIAYCSFIDYTQTIDYLWSGMMQGKSIKEPMVQQGNKSLNEKRLHPTQKPVLLYDLIISFCINRGLCIKRIVDTHLGLASIIISASKFIEIEELIACELDKDYYDAAMQRIKDYQSQLKMF